MSKIKEKDIVRVVDGSYNRDLNTNEKRNGNNSLFENKQGVVLAIKSGEVCTDTVGIPVSMNLIISFSGGIIIACAECCVVKIN